MTANTSVIWTNVQPGPHTVSVELVNNDHTPLSTPVVMTANITVTSPQPTITITQPQPQATVSAGNVPITVQVDNFILLNGTGGSNTAGQGHLIYYMDTVAPTIPGMPATTAAGTFNTSSDTSFTWQNVPTGTHTFAVELVNNDGTPLDQPVVVYIVVVVGTGVSGGGP